MEEHRAAQVLAVGNKNEPNATGLDVVMHARTTPLVPLNVKLSEFWKTQKDLIQRLTISDREEFKCHTDLPLARIKRIMKADDDIRMIRAEAPVLFAKACELFILEMTLRASHFAEDSDRRNIVKDDIYKTVERTPNFDFLLEILREREEQIRINESRAGKKKK